MERLRTAEFLRLGLVSRYVEEHIFSNIEKFYRLAVVNSVRQEHRSLVRISESERITLLSCKVNEPLFDHAVVISVFLLDQGVKGVVERDCRAGNIYKDERIIFEIKSVSSVGIARNEIAVKGFLKPKLRICLYVTVEHISLAQRDSVQRTVIAIRGQIGIINYQIIYLSLVHLLAIAEEYGDLVVFGIVICISENYRMRIVNNRLVRKSIGKLYLIGIIELIHFKRTRGSVSHLCGLTNSQGSDRSGVEVHIARAVLMRLGQHVLDGLKPSALSRTEYRIECRRKAADVCRAGRSTLEGRISAALRGCRVDRSGSVVGLTVKVFVGIYVVRPIGCLVVAVRGVLYTRGYRHNALEVGRIVLLGVVHITVVTERGENENSLTLCSQRRGLKRGRDVIERCAEGKIDDICTVVDRPVYTPDNARESSLSVLIENAHGDDLDRERARRAVNSCLVAPERA